MGLRDLQLEAGTAKGFFSQPAISDSVSLMEQFRIILQSSQYFSVKHQDTDLSNILSQTSPADTKVILYPGTTKHQAPSACNRPWSEPTLTSLFSFSQTFIIQTKIFQLNPCLRIFTHRRDSDNQ